MSLLQRLKLILSSNLNALLNKAEEPDKVLEQLLVEMRQQYREAKVQVGRAIADEKRLQTQLNEEEAQVSHWENKARLALRSGNEDLAKRALLRKREVEGRVESFRKQWSDQKAAVEGLKVALVKLNEKIEEARRQKDVLIARHKRAQAQQEIQNTLSGIGDNESFETFERMIGKVEQAEAEAAASVEMAELTRGDGLEEEFRLLESEEAGDQLLADLMARVREEDAAIGSGALEEELVRLKALVAADPDGNTIDVEVASAVDTE